MQLFSKKDLLGLGFVLIFSILMIKGTFAAQDCITVADGNWSDPLIWSDCTGVGGLPDTGESVVIYNNVTVDTNIEVAAITISSGTFDMGSYTVTLNGTNDILNLLNNSEGSVVPGTSTLIITAQGASHNVTVGVSELNNISLNPVVIDEPIYTLNNVALTLSGNLVINPSGSTKGLSVVLGDALTVNGTEGIDLTSTTVDPSTFRLYNYTLNAYSINIGTNNTLQADASDIMVSHDWVNNGNFVRGSSTVFFTGSNPHTISGSTSFAGLNITNPNIGIPVTVTFDEGALTDVKSGLTLQGTSSGGRIKLRS